jgi:hypothetical protein
MSGKALFSQALVNERRETGGPELAGRVTPVLSLALVASMGICPKSQLPFAIRIASRHPARRDTSSPPLAGQTPGIRKINLGR